MSIGRRVAPDARRRDETLVFASKARRHSVDPSSLRSPARERPATHSVARRRRGCARRPRGRRATTAQSATPPCARSSSASAWRLMSHPLISMSPVVSWRSCTAPSAAQDAAAPDRPAVDTYLTDDARRGTGAPSASTILTDASPSGVPSGGTRRSFASHSHASSRPPAASVPKPCTIWARSAIATHRHHVVRGAGRLRSERAATPRGRPVRSRRGDPPGADAPKCATVTAYSRNAWRSSAGSRAGDAMSIAPVRSVPKHSQGQTCERGDECQRTRSSGVIGHAAWRRSSRAPERARASRQPDPQGFRHGAR